MTVGAVKGNLRCSALPRQHGENGEGSHAAGTSEEFAAPVYLGLPLPWRPRRPSRPDSAMVSQLQIDVAPEYRPKLRGTTAQAAALRDEAAVTVRKIGPMW